MSEDFIQQITIALIPLLLSPFIAAAVPWLTNRGKRTRRSNLLKQAQQEIQFLSEWLAIQEKVCAPIEYDAAKMQASRKVTQITALVDAQSRRKQARAMVRHEERSWFRRLLLFYWPANVMGGTFRVLFYFFLLAFMFYLPFSELFLMQKPTFTVDYLIFELLLVTVAVVIPMLLFRSLAIKMDRRGAKNGASDSDTVAVHESVPSY